MDHNLELFTSRGERNTWALILQEKMTLYLYMSFKH